MKGTQSQDVLSHNKGRSIAGAGSMSAGKSLFHCLVFFALFFSNVSRSLRSFENHQHISLGFSDASPRNWNDALCTRSFHCDHL